MRINELRTYLKGYKRPVNTRVGHMLVGLTGNGYLYVQATPDQEKPVFYAIDRAPSPYLRLVQRQINIDVKRWELHNGNKPITISQSRTRHYYVGSLQNRLTLKDIAKFVKTDREFKVIFTPTQTDVTSDTLKRVAAQLTLDSHLDSGVLKAKIKELL